MAWSWSEWGSSPLYLYLSNTCNVTPTPSRSKALNFQNSFHGLVWSKSPIAESISHKSKVAFLMWSVLLRRMLPEKSSHWKPKIQSWSPNRPCKLRRSSNCEAKRNSHLPKKVSDAYAFFRSYRIRLSVSCSKQFRERGKIAINFASWKGKKESVDKIARIGHCSFTMATKSLGSVGLTLLNAAQVAEKYLNFSRISAATDCAEWCVSHSDWNFILSHKVES